VFVNFNILNQLGSPAINSNTFANRPAAGQTGRLFVSTDTFEIYRDNGTTWDLIGGPGTSTITGTGTATQVAYFTSSQAIGSSANLFWDNTNSFLGIGTAAPTAGVHVVDTDAFGMYSQITTVAGTAATSVGLYAKNTTNFAGYAAIFDENTPNSAAGQYPILIRHSLSSGTAAANMATGIHFGLPDDAGTERINQFSMDTTDPAAATYSSRYRFLLRNNGSAVTPFYITGTGIGVFTATPGAALDIHSTGIMAQLNSTSATANSLLAFQRSGNGLWRIGDAYNGGNNFFELHNTVLTNNAIQVLASSNEATFLSGKTYTTGNSIGIAVQHNLTIPNGTNVGLAALGGVNSLLNLTLGGSTTVANTGRQGLEGSTTISFSGAGTLTMTQGTTVRAFSALSSVYAFNGSAVGTITHLAGLRICFPDNVGSAVNITNNYALLINDQTTGTGTVTYTNRWGIYQEGASDLNYVAANLLIGSTVNNGAALQVTGNGYFSGNVGIGTTNPTRALTVLGKGQFTSTSATNEIYLADVNTTTIDNQWIGSVGNNIIIGAGGSERMRITSGGDVGIGTTSPAGKLNINGISSGISLRMDHTGSYSAFLAYINNTDYIGIDNLAGAMAIYAGSSERMRITSTGNVGIGTITPYSKLDVRGGAILRTTSDFVAGSTGSAISLNLGANTGNTFGSIVVGINGDTVSGNTVLSQFGGNVLIGTTTDTAGYKLQTAGNLYLEGNIFSNTTLVYPKIIMGGIVNPPYLQAFWTDNNNSYWEIHTFEGAVDKTAVRINNDMNTEFGKGIKTANPTGGTAKFWKLGNVASVTPTAQNRTIEVEIDGTTYYITAKTTND